MLVPISIGGADPACCRRVPWISRITLDLRKKDRDVNCARRADPLPSSSPPPGEGGLSTSMAFWPTVDGR
jgi:hypothetical protein